MIFSVADKHLMVDSPKTTHKILIELLDCEDEIDRDKEHFWTLLLNARNIITTIELVSMGTVSASIVHPREVFRRAISVASSSIILAHNHPSGFCEPSDADVILTDMVVKAGKILDIAVLDHLIVTKERYYSFKEQGLL